MTGEWIRFGLTALCVLAGCFALLTAMVGLFRFDFTLNRLHAASIADTLGLSLLVLAVIWYSGTGFRQHHQGGIGYIERCNDISCKVIRSRTIDKI